MADSTETTSNHVPVLEAVQPPKYTTNIPQTLLGQIIVISFLALIILCLLVWAEMPPVAIGFAFAIPIVVVGLAIYNATIMRATSGTETNHILQIRNDEASAQNAVAMMATSQNNELIKEIISHAVQARSPQPGMMAPPIQGQYTQAAPLRRSSAPTRIGKDNANLLEYDNDH